MTANYELFDRRTANLIRSYDSRDEALRVVREAIARAALAKREKAEKGGQVDDADWLELEDLEASLRGFAEVHAALAAIIYNERPYEVAYAEEQFDLASEFDKRYLDISWVSKEKHWPPAMIAALDKFANLRG